MIKTGARQARRGWNYVNLNNNWLNKKGVYGNEKKKDKKGNERKAREKAGPEPGAAAGWQGAGQWLYDGGLRV